MWWLCSDSRSHRQLVGSSLYTMCLEFINLCCRTVPDNFCLRKLRAQIYWPWLLSCLPFTNLNRLEIYIIAFHRSPEQSRQYGGNFWRFYDWFHSGCEEEVKIKREALEGGYWGGRGELLVRGRRIQHIRGEWRERLKLFSWLELFGL